MDHMDNVRERFEALEQQTAELKHQTYTLARQARWWRGIACGLGLLGLVSLPLQSGTAADTQPGGMAERMANLEKKLGAMAFDDAANEVVITGANLRIVNGLGSTNTTNGLGNLIVGYNEPRQFDLPDIRTGSHNVVVGREHNFSRFGGLVVGLHSEISGDYASVSGGTFNTASGSGSSVSGGLGTTASGDFASVSGGTAIRASGDYASVSGGINNVATGLGSSVSGGINNVASGSESSVSGGNGNTATGPASSVSGGDQNRASGSESSVSGGAKTGLVGTSPRSVGGSGTRPPALPPRSVGGSGTRRVVSALRSAGVPTGVHQARMIGPLVLCLPITSVSAAGGGATHLLTVSD
jgi:hypothetical protein